ncbi:MAG: glutathione S-transferase family protein [Candidatus Competibacter sp.]
MLKLYYHPLSTFTRRVLIALIEKAIPHELISVDMAAREHTQPAYRTLNPYGRVPTLMEDDFVLYESTAILNYLEAICPSPPLTPADPRGRALVDMHMKLCDLELARQTGTIIFPKRFLPEQRWNRAEMKQAKAEVEQHLEILESLLAGREYLIGDRYTLAEVCYTPFVQFFPLMDIAPPSAVGAWVERILNRPSAVQTQPSH